MFYFRAHIDELYIFIEFDRHLLLRLLLID
jgi:hypothetical protein